MRIKLTTNITMIGGEILHRGTEFDVSEDMCVGPLTGNKPRSLRISVAGTIVALFYPEFDVLEQADEQD